MESPIISVIIPSFQQGRYLRDAIESVFAQTYHQWEIIIVNDGSDDETESVAKEYADRDTRVHYLYQENAGVACARNRGISVALGFYILPLDADDKIADSYLRKAVDFLQGHDEYSVFYGRAEFFGDKQGPWNVHYNNYKNLLVYNQIYSSCVYRKSDWVRVGGYDESFKHGAEDMEFNIRLLYHNDKVFQDEEVLFFYRKDYSRKSVTNIGIDHSAEIDKALLIKHYDKYVEFYGSPFLLIKDYIRLIEWTSRKMPKRLYKFMLWYQRMCNRLIG